MDTIGGCPIVLHEHGMHLRGAMSDVFSLVFGTWVPAIVFGISLWLCRGETLRMHPCMRNNMGSLSRSL